MKKITGLLFLVMMSGFYFGQDNLKTTTNYKVEKQSIPKKRYLQASIYKNSEMREIEVDTINPNSIPRKKETYTMYKYEQKKKK